LSLRRLAPEQPASFAFTPDNKAWADKQIAKYPKGREASAVVPLLWRAQEQNGGHVTEPMIRVIGEMLHMSKIRVLEIATFYTMFNLAPVGKFHLQVCTTPPCLLRGSDEVVHACQNRIARGQNVVTPDGMLSWTEVECLGACVNAPMMQVGNDYYEDLDGPITEKLIEAFRRGETPKPGPQTGRTGAEPATGPNSLTDRSIYSKSSGTT
jgi:NADH-quinone oxidoreductase subunit E